MTFDTAQGQRSSEGDLALAEYSKGMKVLGWTLVALGILHIAVAALHLFPPRDGFAFALVMLGCISAITFGLGMFALRLRCWANYVVVTLAGLALLFSGAAVVLQLKSAGVGTSVLMVIAVALAFFGVKNLRALFRARRLGAKI